MNRDVVSKFDRAAERYSASDYADAERYYERRARVVVEFGPRIHSGQTLLDVACGDGGLGRHLLAYGIDYRGVDASAGMVSVARRALGDRVEQASFDYAPPEGVDATSMFRALYLVPDRRAFLAHVRSYTRGKLIFDFDPRRFAAREVLADVRAAGFEHVEVRPFLMPQRAALPAVVQAGLFALEPLPGARLLTRVRFPLVVSAWA